MDHLVRTDVENNELERLYKSISVMIVRGSMNRRSPHGEIREGDRLFFVQGNDEDVVRATARVRRADSTPLLDQEASIIRILQNQRKLMLTERQFARWGGLRYLVFIEIEGLEWMEQRFIVDSSLLGMGGWAVLDDISTVKRSLPSSHDVRFQDQIQRRQAGQIADHQHP